MGKCEPRMDANKRELPVTWSIEFFNLRVSQLILVTHWYSVFYWRRFASIRGFCFPSPGSAIPRLISAANSKKTGPGHAPPGRRVRLMTKVLDYAELRLSCLEERPKSLPPPAAAAKFDRCRDAVERRRTDGTRADHEGHVVVSSADGGIRHHGRSRFRSRGWFRAPP